MLPPDINRALEGSLLRTRRSPLLIGVLVLLLVLGVVGNISVLVDASLLALGVYATGFVVATLWCLPTMALLYWLDRRERESLWLLAGALLFGVLVSTGIAGLFNNTGVSLLEAVLAPSSMVNGPQDPVLVLAFVSPVVEECAKALGLWLIFWLLHAEFDTVRDGIIFGAFIGLGFHLTEYALYLVDGFIAYNVIDFFGLLALRLPSFGLSGHTVWTALAGAGIGLARQTRSPRVRLWAPIGCLGIAMLSHLLNNTLGLLLIIQLITALGGEAAPDRAASVAEFPGTLVGALVGNLATQAISYALLAFLLLRSARWEVALIAEYLADEVGTPSVTPEEYALILADQPFRTRRLPYHNNSVARALVNAQNELAFRKWHLARSGNDPASDPLVAAWRADIQRLREIIG